MGAIVVAVVIENIKIIAIVVIAVYSELAARSVIASTVTIIIAAL